MVMAANFFKLDSVDSDSDEERSKAAVESQGAGKSIKNNKKKKKKESVEKADSGDDAVKKSKKKKKIGDTESSKFKEESRRALASTEDDDNGAKRKRKRVEDTALGAEGDTSQKPRKKKKKKPRVYLDNILSSATENPEKQIDDPEVEDAVKKQTENPEAQGKVQKKKSTKDPKKKSKKKKKQIDYPEVDSTDNQIQTETPEKKQRDNKDSTEEKTHTEAEENHLNSPENGKKKKKKNNNKQSEEPAAEEDNNKEKKKKKKKKKKQKDSKSAEVVTTPQSKSAKKVNFSDHVEVFPADESEESDDDEQAEVVRGKRFTEEEDELIKKSVLEYVDNHALGDQGINMVMNCKSHKQVKGCWKEIAAALPWRPYSGVYYRAHTLFEEGSKGVWSKEDLELVVEYQKKHGNDWRALADAMGKHRNHVKDAWRRIRLASKKKGHWAMEEYQSLFDLVNKDLRMKAFKEKHSKHGMLRDNIPWMAISDQLGTRDHAVCCTKWYDQLTSPMVAKGIWANVDDYRLLEELTNLDAACVDDVDWDHLLDNRDGDACRCRWNQMVNHIGIPGSKTFAEQVEIMSERYCPDIAEDREDFDNRPFDPED